MLLHRPHKPSTLLCQPNALAALPLYSTMFGFFFLAANQTFTPCLNLRDLLQPQRGPPRSRLCFALGHGQRTHRREFAGLRQLRNPKSDRLRVGSPPPPWQSILLKPQRTALGQPRQCAYAVAWAVPTVATASRQCLRPGRQCCRQGRRCRRPRRWVVVVRRQPAGPSVPLLPSWAIEGL